MLFSTTHDVPGYDAVRSLPVRDTSLVALSPTYTSARIPSSFGSNTHPSASNAAGHSSASIGANVGGAFGGTSGEALAMNTSQSSFPRDVLTRWYSCPAYRSPWSRNDTFVSVHSSGSYVPRSHSRTSPAP